MAFKPNYRMQRADRNRAKDLKKQEKLARRAEASEKRKAAREAAGAESPAAESAADPGTGRDPETT
jgi:hypothetical protein